MSHYQFTSKSEQTILAALELCRHHSHVHCTPVHLALALFEEAPSQGGAQNLLLSILNKAGVDPTLVARAFNKQLVRLPSQEPAPAEPDMSPALHKVLREAQKLQKEQHDSFISQDHLLLALLTDTQIATAFKEAGVTEAALKNAITSVRGGKRVDTRQAEDGFEALAKYGNDLTKAAEEGSLDPVIGRADELRRMIRILCRKQKNNCILIGEPGVGKTAICEALAMRIVNHDVPVNLQGRLWALDMGSLMAGASHKGEFEERVKSVLQEVEKSEVPIILFIDEIHLLMAGKDGGGGIDAGNLLKPALARGKIRCIGATTLNEFKKTIEKDTALERRFGTILVNEPTVPEAIGIIRGIRERYELFHQCSLLDSSIVTACTLAHRYLPARRLPDSAIDAIDEAAAGVKLDRDSTPENIDKLERRRLQLEVEIAALERETSDKKKFKVDDAAVDRLQAARKEVGDINDELGPLKAAYDAAKRRNDEIAAVRQRIDQLKSKIERAERERDLATAADLRHFAIPDLHHKLEDLERIKAQEDAERGPQDIVTPDHVTEVIARWSGVPVTKLRATESQRLLQLEKILSRDIVGQPEAIRKVSEAIRMSRSGLLSPNRPIASFLLVGPSGTGKTQLTKVLAKFLFDSEEAVIRIDCSEYTEKHSLSRLIGSPPGYVGYDEGGFLTEAIKRRPYSIILIDEIEKAHRSFQTLFLQVLDNGRLTDGQGRTVDFRNTLVIMTSNLGSAALNAAPDGPLSDPVKAQIYDAIRGHFLPEFLGRVDEQIIFSPLGSQQVRQIVDIRLAEIQHRLTANGKNVRIHVSPEAKDWLAAHGVSRQFGARLLARAIQENVLVPLSRMLLDGQIHENENEVAKVALDGQRNRIYIEPNHPATVNGADGMDLDEEDVEVEEMD